MVAHSIKYRRMNWMWQKIYRLDNPSRDILTSSMALPAAYNLWGIGSGRHAERNRLLHQIGHAFIYEPNNEVLNQLPFFVAVSNCSTKLHRWRAISALLRCSAIPEPLSAPVLCNCLWGSPKMGHPRQTNEKKGYLYEFIEMATPAGLEPATTCLEGRCSIQLSYGA
jgi:hypothetical protein